MDIPILTPSIEEYLLDLLPESPALIREMEARAEAEGFPIVGPLVGRLLYLLARLKSPQRVLELGSGYGYSAFWFAAALGPEAEIHLTEFSKENLEAAKGYLSQARLTCRIHYHQGDALEIVDRIPGSFDLIFNDLDKYQYPEGLRKTAPRLRPGGLFISDNVLWYGRVLAKEPDQDTRGVQEFNRLIFQGGEFFSTIIPLRDGVSVSLKL